MGLKCGGPPGDAWIILKQATWAAAVVVVVVVVVAAAAAAAAVVLGLDVIYLCSVFCFVSLLARLCARAGWRRQTGGSCHLFLVTLPRALPITTHPRKQY
jgi:hypothetical protein